MCVRIVALVLRVTPSPKFQERFVIVPVEVSEKVTDSGIKPLVGSALNDATGTIPPMPIRVLLIVPPLPLLKTIALVKALPVSGANRTLTLVERLPARLT